MKLAKWNDPVVPVKRNQVRPDARSTPRVVSVYIFYLRTSFVISWIIRAFGRLLRLRDRWLRSSRFNINVRSAGFWDNGRTHRLRLLRLWWLLSGSLRDELLFLGRVDEPVLFLIDFGLRLGLGLGLRLRPDRCTRSDEFFRSLSQTGRSWGYDTLGLFQLILAGF